MTKTRAQRAAALEQWADRVAADDLVVADTDALRSIAELAEQRDEVDAALMDAIVRRAFCRRSSFSRRRSHCESAAS